MLGKDTQWYVDKLDQISAFEKWIELVKSDLSKQIADLLKDAAEAALSELENNEGFEGYSLFPVSKDNWGYEVYWSLGESWNDQKEIGAYISAWIPSGIEWLTSETGDRPSLGLYYNAGRSSKTKEIGQKLLKAIKGVPQGLGKKIGRIEDDYYVCIQRSLDGDVDPSALRDPKLLESKLTGIFKEFTKIVHPGLETASPK